jgi:hypothetical protein
MMWVLAVCMTQHKRELKPVNKPYVAQSHLHLLPTYSRRETEVIANYPNQEFVFSNVKVEID